MPEFHNFFIPHRTTHKKAFLISWEALLIYALLFLLLRVGFNLTNLYKPGVLGINSSITQNQILDLTNKERQKLGLSDLKDNPELDQAATAKAANMFTENYWAHFAPSGKSPWDFILASGYHFTFAGENLAKNFYNSSDVVTAWMNSPTHRENLLNNKFDDIGIAVVDGVLNGQKTTLVVQEFGTTKALSTLPSVQVSGQNLKVPTVDLNKPQITPLVAGEQIAKATLDPYQITKSLSLILFSMMAFLMVLDFLIIRKRGVLRVNSHYLAHLAFISSMVTAVLVMGVGAIL